MIRNASPTYLRFGTNTTDYGPMGWLASRQDGVDECQYAPVVVARNAPLGMRIHMLFGIVDDKAVTDALLGYVDSLAA